MSLAFDRVAKRLGLDLDRVSVNVTLLGGGFGRKSKPDFAIEAALHSQAMVHNSRVSPGALTLMDLS